MNLPDAIGCSSHSCVIRPPVGMGTNGPCRCVNWKGQRYITQLHKRIAELEAEVERYQTSLTVRDRKMGEQVHAVARLHGRIAELEDEMGSKTIQWCDYCGRKDRELYKFHYGKPSSWDMPATFSEVILCQKCFGTTLQLLNKRQAMPKD